MNQNIKFACPCCISLLDINLKCPSCQFIGKFEDKKYHLHRYDKTWEECVEQVNAARKAEKDVPAPNNINTPPQIVKPEDNEAVKINTRMQDTILEILGDIKGKTMLEIGGASGWATKRFIREGVEFGVVIDIDHTLMIASEDKMVSVIGDGYYIPFPDEQFDFVFDCSALHHFVRKIDVLKQIKRVLKKGGYYASQGNPPRTRWNEDKDRKRYWDKYGLIETMPTQVEYRSFFMEVFGNVEFVPVGNNMVMSTVKGE